MNLMKVLVFFFYYYCKAFSFNAVKCVILVPCQESPLTQKPQGNLSHHLRVFMVLSLTLRSLTDLELVPCGLCYQMNFFPYVVKWKNKFLQKDHHFPLLAQPPRLKKKWGRNKGLSVDRSSANLPLLFLWSENCPFIDPSFCSFIIVFNIDRANAHTEFDCQFSILPSQRTSAWIWTVIEHPRFFHGFLSIYLGPSLSSLKNVIPTAPPPEPLSTLHYIQN